MIRPVFPDPVTNRLSFSFQTPIFPNFQEFCPLLLASYFKKKIASKIDAALTVRVICAIIKLLYFHSVNEFLYVFYTTDNCYKLLLIHVLSSQQQLTVLNNRLKAFSLFPFVNARYSSSK